MLGTKFEVFSALSTLSIRKVHARATCHTFLDNGKLGPSLSLPSKFDTRFGTRAACLSLISGEGRGGSIPFYSKIVGITIDKLVYLLFKEMPEQILV